jgi:hypothetical protein
MVLRCHSLEDGFDRDDCFLVKKINGMASGPKRAPMMAQNKVFAPLLSAMHHSRYAHPMLMMERTVAPIITVFSSYPDRTPGIPRPLGI